MDDLYHKMIEQFEKLERKIAAKDCISSILIITEEQSRKFPC